MHRIGVPFAVLHLWLPHSNMVLVQLWLPHLRGSDTVLRVPFLVLKLSSLHLLLQNLIDFFGLIYLDLLMV